MSLEVAISALRNDLLAEEGPRISTMRNYNFAILVYDPREEFELRRQARKLSDHLKTVGWNVLGISLHRLMLDRIQGSDPGLANRFVTLEKTLAAQNPDQALNYVTERISQLVEGEDGLAADVASLINGFADDIQADPARTLVLVGRVGACYPFFRSSALLKHLDGKTRNFPVVLLYPGQREGATGLSFMGELPADRDYRPRIYA